MDTDTILLIILGFLINLIILFSVIFFAVRYATSKLLRAQQIQNFMLAEYLKSKGFDPKTAVETVNEIDQLKSQKAGGYITNEQFREKLKEYIL